MDLVAHHLHVVTAAYVGHALQLFASPSASRGIVRVAEQQHAVGGIGAERLQRVKINLIGEIVVVERLLNQRRLHHPAAVVSDRREETVIDRRHHYHAVARRGKSLDNGRQRGHHPGRVDHLRGTDVPAVAPGKPLSESAVIARAHMRVAEHAMIHPAAQRVGDAGSRAEIHVGHPERDEVAAMLRVPFVRTRAAAVYDFIKIIFYIHCREALYLPGSVISPVVSDIGGFRCRW